MTSGAHDAGGGFGRSAGANAARGIAVIIAAVMLGSFLMARGIGDSDSESATDSSTTSTTTTDGTDSGGSSTTDAPITTVPTDPDTTLGPQRPPAEVLTLSVNGTDPTQPGVAGDMRDFLAANGYATADPKNADTKGPSVILFIETYESDARAIAVLLGVDPDVVVQPFDAATSPIADTQGAAVIVMVGNDGVITV